MQRIVIRSVASLVSSLNIIRRVKINRLPDLPAQQLVRSLAQLQNPHFFYLSLLFHIILISDRFGPRDLSDVTIINIVSPIGRYEWTQKKREEKIFGTTRWIGFSVAWQNGILIIIWRSHAHKYTSRVSPLQSTRLLTFLPWHSNTHYIRCKDYPVAHFVVRFKMHFSIVPVWLSRNNVQLAAAFFVPIPSSPYS